MEGEQNAFSPEEIKQVACHLKESVLCISGNEGEMTGNLSARKPLSYFTTWMKLQNNDT